MSVSRDKGAVPTYIFFAILVAGNVDSTEGASTDFLLDHILVDAMLGHPIVLAGDIFRSSVERLLQLISAGWFEVLAKLP